MTYCQPNGLPSGAGCRSSWSNCTRIDEVPQKSMLAELVRKLTYFPDRVDDLSPGRWQLPAERVEAITLQTDDGLTLNGWHFISAARSTDDRLLAILFSGNGGHRGYRVAEARLLTN